MPSSWYVDTWAFRRYGSGKFRYLIDEYIYQYVLEADEHQAGDVESPMGYNAAIWMREDETTREFFNDLKKAVEDGGEVLTEDEAAGLRDCQGIIVNEDSDGFVTVDYWRNNSEARLEWLEIERQVAEDYESQDPDAYDEHDDYEE